ncbi:MAG TPA: pilus assembly protein TadG-related protein [Desulfobaccales bacterium]
MKMMEHGQPGSVADKRSSSLMPGRNPTHQMQTGQTTVFFTLVLTGLLILTAVAIEVGRIVYARGEVGKAADAAALAAAARINVPENRETGQMVFLPDVYSSAQDAAIMNASTLAKASHFLGPFCFIAQAISFNWYFSASARSTGSFGTSRIEPPSSTTASSKSPSFRFALRRRPAGRVICPLLRIWRKSDILFYSSSDIMIF